jgi:hypothetical protein
MGNEAVGHACWLFLFEQYKVDEPLSIADVEAFTMNQGLSSSVVVDLLIDREGTV